MAISLVAGTLSNNVDGMFLKKNARIAFDNSYPTGGESYSALLASLGLTSVSRIEVNQEAGYVIEVDYTNSKFKVFRTAAVTPAGTLSGEATHTHAVALDTGVSDATSGGTPAGTNGTSSVTGTGTFVGTSAGSLELASPAFNGTGYATAAQVITTTDNQTMTLNQCAGMWFIADALTSTAPVLIVSNTAVTGAPAVLTVIGTAPVTDGGTYKIVKNILPTGSVTALSGTAAAQTFTGSALATHTHGPGTLADAASGAGSSHTHTLTGTAQAQAALAEVTAAVDLSTDLAAVEMDFIGL